MLYEVITYHDLVKKRLKRLGRWLLEQAPEGEIKPYHRYAVVMLIDQGYDTMEGASGDDWISGSQSMRAYLRGAVIAGISYNFV